MGIKRGAYLWEIALFGLNNTACRAWIIDGYGEQGGGMSFLRDT